MNKIEKARQKYKPESIRYLFIAETPPKSDSERFFYFEDVDNQDSLFLETMKILYPQYTDGVDTKEIRKTKKVFLEKFKRDGYYLIDSLNSPFEEKFNPSRKVRLLREGQKDLLSRIKLLLNRETEVILISATVHKANYEFLRSNGIPVINEELIDFPGSGGQKKFREKIKSILQRDMNS